MNVPQVTIDRIFDAVVIRQIKSYIALNQHIDVKTK